MDKESPEFGTAVVKAQEEFQTLTMGRENLDIKETLDVRDYARLRTDLSKPDAELTNEQGAWKLIYVSIDAQIAACLTPEQKRKIDEAKKNFFAAAQLRDTAGGFSGMGRRIEDLLIQQFDIIAFHFDEKDNDYKANEAKFGKVMTDATLKNETRVQAAQTILKIADTYENGPVETLRRVNAELQRLLARCEQMLVQAPEQLADSELSRIFKKSKQWLMLTKELYLARALAINGVLGSLEVDKRLPKLIAERGENLDRTLSSEESQQFANDVTTYAALFKESHARNERIQKEREPLAKELFPENSESQQTTASASPTSFAVQPRPRSPLESNSWFRLVKVVYIALALFAGLFAAFVGLAFDSGTAFVGTLVVFAVLLFVVRKGFYYVFLGRTTVREPAGSGFLDLEDIRDDFSNLAASSPEFHNEFIAPFLESWKRQFGRRVPLSAYDGLRKRIDEGIEKSRLTRHELAAKAAKEGGKLEIAKLREDMEKWKAEYRGPDRLEQVRALDSELLRLESKYGAFIPMDEAMKVLDVAARLNPHFFELSPRLLH